jgi:hypothetical protein
MFDIFFSLYVRNVCILNLRGIGKGLVYYLYIYCIVHKKENAEKGLQWVTDRYQL